MRSLATAVWSAEHMTKNSTSEVFSSIIELSMIESKMRQKNVKNVNQSPFEIN